MFFFAKYFRTKPFFYISRRSTHSCESNVYSLLTTIWSFFIPSIYTVYIKQCYDVSDVTLEQYNFPHVQVYHRIHVSQMFTQSTRRFRQALTSHLWCPDGGIGMFPGTTSPRWQLAHPAKWEAGVGNGKVFTSWSTIFPLRYKPQSYTWWSDSGTLRIWVYNVNSVLTDYTGQQKKTFFFS